MTEGEMVDYRGNDPEHLYIAMGGGRKPKKKISIINFECVN